MPFSTSITARFPSTCQPATSEPGPRKGARPSATVTNSGSIGHAVLTTWFWSRYLKAQRVNAANTMANASHTRPGVTRPARAARPLACGLIAA